MKTVYIFLADGCEEIEALTPVDILRRAEVPVVMVGVNGKTVTGGHGIKIEADVDGAGFALPEDAAMVVLPGGGEGTEHLAQSPMVARALQDAAQRNLYIAAICAAPTVLQAAGLLAGKRATAFPSVQPQLTGDTTVTGAAVEVDGNIITGRSMGVALQFAHALAAAVAGRKKADAVVEKVYPER